VSRSLGASRSANDVPDGAHQVEPYPLGEGAALGAYLDDVSDASAEDRSRALFGDHIAFIWRLLRRLGVSAADVEDAAQHVFIIAAKRLHEISPGAERPFLYGTAVRVASNVRRDAARRERALGNFRFEVPPANATPDDELQRREALELLDEALSSLTDELRRVFVLCDIEELPAREVALLENIPAGTVASRLRRAREVFETRVHQLRSLPVRAP
jgi:RNA polymerase sigma-70 factor (ECF subfamily)